MAVCTATVMTEEVTDTEQEIYNTYDTEYYTNKAYDAFVNFGVAGSFTKYGIENNVENWLDGKEPLFNLLRKHPNWNEEAKAIILHTQEKRETSQDTIITLFRRITKLKSWVELEDNFPQNVGDDIFYFYHHPLGQYVDETLYNFFNEKYPDLHIHKGSKTSRALNKFFTYYKFNEHTEYNRLYAALADALNPLVVEKISVLSVNFLDYCLMSNGNSWTSCHNIIPGHYGEYSDGCCKAGCISYAVDGVSMVFYTIDKNYDGSDYCFEEKLNRQVFMYKDGTIVQDRLYPQCHDDDDANTSNSLVRQYREIVENIIATCLDKPNLWHKAEKNVNITKAENAYMYEDWEYFKHWVYAINNYNGTDGTDDTDNVVDIDVGDDCYCLDCGDLRTDDDRGELYCPSCCHAYYCADCGCYLDEDEACYSEEDEEYYCYECSFWCNYHERYEPYNRHIIYYIENYGDICDDAYDETGDFGYCEECGQYYQIDQMNILDNGAEICNGCFNVVCATCSDCGAADYINNFVEVDGDWYCSCCAEDHIREDEDEDTGNETAEADNDNSDLSSQLIGTTSACPNVCVKSLTDLGYAIYCKTPLEYYIFKTMCKDLGYQLEDVIVEDSVFYIEDRILHITSLNFAKDLNKNIITLQLQPTSVLFDISLLFGNDIVVVCNTAEDAARFVNSCAAMGIGWYPAGSLTQDANWDWGILTYYGIDRDGKMFRGYLHDAIRNGYQIMEFDSIDVTKFDINNIIGRKIAINCVTKAEAVQFMIMCADNNITWVSGAYPIGRDAWDNYEMCTCYSINTNRRLEFSSSTYYRDCQYTIIPFATLTSYARTA